MSTPFRNNLKKGDRVLDATTKLAGTVARDPGEKNRRTYVLFSVRERAKGVDVMTLRFIPPNDNVAEDVPPIEGEPPPYPKFEMHAPGIAPVSVDPVSLLKADKAGLEREIETMNIRAREIRVKIERLDRAINALEGRA